MLTDGVVIVSVGIVALLLPLSSGYRTHLSRRLAERADAQVPGDQAPALEARVTRRARGVGTGIVLAGLATLTTALVDNGASWSPTGNALLVLAVVFVFGAAGLAVVEMMRPGALTDGPRFARSTVPRLADYVPPQMRVASWGVAGLSLLVLVLVLLLGQTRWFDGETIWRSPVPFLAAAVPLVAVLTTLAVRRVLDAAQPARDETELYWQDAVRANTLSSLLVPPALLGLLGLIVSGTVLDDAASAVAVASGQVGPVWSLWLLTSGYVLPFVIVIGLLAAITRASWDEMRHVRDRLWAGRPAGRPASPREA